MKVFWPLSTNSSPSGLTVVRIPPKASEPASGSVIAQAPTFSKVIRSRAQRLRCSTVPLALMVPAARPMETPIAAGMPIETFTSSIWGSTASAGSIPSPDDEDPSPEIERSKLSAAIASRPKVEKNFRIRSYGGRSPCSSSSWCGRISLSTKDRTASRMASWSLVHVNMGRD